MLTQITYDITKPKHELLIRYAANGVGNQFSKHRYVLLGLPTHKKIFTPVENNPMERLIIILESATPKLVQQRQCTSTLR